MGGPSGIGGAGSANFDQFKVNRAAPQVPQAPHIAPDNDLTIDTSQVKIPQINVDDSIHIELDNRLPTPDLDQITELGEVAVPTLEKAKEAVQLAKGAITEELAGLEEEIAGLVADLPGELENLTLASPEKALEILGDLAEETVGQLGDLKAIQAQLNGVLENAAARGEDALNKIKERIGPQLEKVNALIAQIEGVENQINQLVDKLPFDVDFRQLKASIEVKNSVAELSAEVSRAGASAEATISTETLNAFVRASTQSGIEGRVEVNSGALRAMLEASSNGTLNGQVEITTEALQLMVKASDGKFTAEAQAQINESVQLALQAGPDELSGRITIDNEAFQMLVNMTASPDFGSGSAHVSIQAEDFELALQAATGEGVSGQVTISTDSLKIMAQAAYKETLSAQLGVSTDEIQVNLGTDGQSVSWSVGAQTDFLAVNMGGEFNDRGVQMSGSMEFSDTGIQISVGQHDYGVDVPPEMLERARSMGGDVVNMQGTGFMLSMPF